MLFCVCGGGGGGVRVCFRVCVCVVVVVLVGFWGFCCCFFKMVVNGYLQTNNNKQVSGLLQSD